MLVIRYRKVQILSWRNLLRWKKEKIVRNDVEENYIRLLHTIEKQVFDNNSYKQYSKKTIDNEVETKIFELLDLFIRNSNLG
jgi:hypothetical protein